MRDYVWLLVAGVCLFYIVVDILLHRLMGVRRRASHVGLLALLIAGFCLAAGYGVYSGYVSGQASARNGYQAYRYLEEGRPELAVGKAGQLPGGAEADMICLLASAVSGDYLSAYFQAEALLGGNLDAETERLAADIRRVARQMLGMDGQSEQAAPGTALSVRDGEGVPDYDLAESAMLGLVERALRERVPGDGGAQESYYQMDKLLHTDVAELDREDVTRLLAQYGETEEILQLAIKYYIYAGDWPAAKQYGAELARRYPGPESYIVYTDVVSQVAKESVTPDLSDPEVQALMASVERLENAMAELDPDAWDWEVSYSELQVEAQALTRRALQLDIYRAINYLEAKRPLLFDTTGLYDLQMAKLYLAVDDRQTAKAYIYAVIENSDRLDDMSILKDPLTKVVDEYNQSVPEESNPQLGSAVYDLVRTESQDIIPMDEGTINGELSNYMTSTLKYDKVNIHIGRIDPSAYPQVKAYANVSGYLQDIEELASDFTEADFELIDTQYRIEDFHLVREEAADSYSIAVVMDVSGSMAGVPLTNAKTAAAELFGRMDAETQQMGLITYDDSAKVVSGLTRQSAVLVNGANSLASGGGTNISAGVEAGVSVLAGQEGARAIILMTDGQDNNTVEAMEAAIAQAVAGDVAIYAVGFGDCEADYLEWIAESTGGKFILADNSTELVDVYGVLQRYITNNYVFSYTVTQNTEIDWRNLTVNIHAYGASANRVYSVSGAVMEDGEAYDITRLDPDSITIASVTPGSVTVASLAEGLDVTVHGTGFREGMDVSVGGASLTNLEIVDEYTATGRLAANLGAGYYDLRVSLPGGRTDIAHQKFKVFRTGTTESVRVGQVTVTADYVGSISDSVFVATGNVRVNNFLHTNGDMTITVSDVAGDYVLGDSESNKLGDKGSIAGEEALYISYAQASQTNTLYASLVLMGKDYVVSDAGYYFTIDGRESTISHTRSNWDIEIPFICKMPVANVKLTPESLRVEVSNLSVESIVTSVTDAFEKKQSIISGTYQKRDKDTNLLGVSGSLTVALTGENIVVGGQVELDENSPLNFGRYFGVKEFSVKVDTLSSSHEYWRISGKIDLSSTLGNLDISGFGGYLSSYYWFPDTLSLSASLDPGIPVAKVVNLTEIGGRLEGMSTIGLWLAGESMEDFIRLTQGEGYLETRDVEDKDVMLAGTLGADVNLFKTMGITFIEDLTQWGELGKIDAEIGVYFTQFKLRAEADMELFKTKVADASLEFTSSGMTAAGNLGADISGFGIDLGGNIEMKTVARVVGKSSMQLAVEGHLDVGFMDFHANGRALARFEFIPESKYVAVIVEAGTTSGVDGARFWYESTGKLRFWRDMHWESYSSDTFSADDLDVNGGGSNVDGTGGAMGAGGGDGGGGGGGGGIWR